MFSLSTQEGKKRRKEKTTLTILEVVDLIVLYLLSQDAGILGQAVWVGVEERRPANCISKDTVNSTATSTVQSGT